MAVVKSDDPKIPADDEDYADDTGYADQEEEPWFKPWKVPAFVHRIKYILSLFPIVSPCLLLQCGLCEKVNDVEQHFCAVCQRDRSLEYKWTYSFKQSAMQLKTYQPFVKPEVTWDTIEEQETWD